MPDLNDGEALDFRRIFRVHRIFAAVPLALRPGSILLATFVTLLLTLGGRAWDGLRGPVIEPPGLLQPVPSDAARNAVKARLSRTVVEFVPREDRPDGLSPDAVDPHWLHGALDRARRSLDPEKDSVQVERIARAMVEVDLLKPRGTFEATTRAMGQAINAMTDGVITAKPDVIVAALGAAVIDLPVALWTRDRGFVLFYGLFAAIVAAVGGGALARMTAVAFADRPAMNPSDASGFALSRWTSFAFAIVLPPLFVGGLFLLGGLMGLLLRVPLINVLAGAFYGVALLFGLIAAIVALLWLIVIPLAAPAAACDGADAVESCQRAAAYVLRRPLLAFGYFVAAIAAWGVGVFVVRLVYVTTTNLTAASGRWLSNAPALGSAGGARLFGSEPAAPMLLTGTDRATAGLIDFWMQTAGVLATGAAFAIFWSIATAVYLCLRHACDDQPFDDLWEPEDAPSVRLEA